MNPCVTDQGMGYVMRIVIAVSILSVIVASIMGHFGVTLPF